MAKKKQREVDLSGVDFSGLNLPQPPDQELPEGAAPPALPGPVTLPQQQLIPVPGGVQLPDGTVVPLPDPVEANRGAPARGLASADAPDLSGVDLSGIDLSKIDLSGVEGAAPDVAGVASKKERKGFWGKLQEDLAPWMADTKTPDDLKNYSQSRFGGTVQAALRPLTAGSNLAGAGIADAYRAAARQFIGKNAPKTDFEALSSDDWAAAREGEGKGFGTYLKEDGTPELIAAPAGLAVDLLADPTNALSFGATKLARMGKLGKTVQGLEEMLSATNASKKAGKAVYGAPLSGARRNMARYRDAAEKPFGEFVDNLMAENVGRGAGSNAEFLDQVYGSRKSAWENLAEKTGMKDKNLTVDLAPQMDAALTKAGWTRDSVSEVLRRGTTSQKQQMMQVLKEAAPNFKSVLDNLETTIVGQEANATQDFVAGLGEDLARGPIDLDTAHKIKGTYTQKAYGSTPMAQNAATTNFRGNNAVSRSQKTSLSFGDVMDDMLDDEAMKRAASAAQASGMPVDQAALVSEQAAKKAAAKEAGRKYGVQARGYSGAASDVAKYEAKAPITVLDGMLAAGTGAEFAVNRDPGHAAAGLAALGAKRFIRSILQNPKNAAKAGLLLRDIGKTSAWDTLGRGALLRNAADLATEE